MKQAKILLYDLETSSNIAHVWNHYETNVLAYVKEWDILAVGWKWLGEKAAHVKTRADFRDSSDRSLVKHLHGLLNSADVVIGHNSLDFDNKKANARFAFHGLPPASPAQQVDTCRVARSVFKFNSNKLEDLVKHLGLGKKGTTGGFALWESCMAGDRTALAKMGRYCKQDVALLERVYLKLRPYMKRHPNLSLIEAGEKNGCPNCGSQKVIRMGRYFNLRSVVQGMLCNACGARYRVPMAAKEAA